MSSPSASTDMSSGVSKLSLQTPGSKKTTTKSKPEKKEVADSWEDEDVSSGSDTETESDWRAEPSEGHAQGTAAPPPTPISPTYGQSAATVSAPSASRGEADLPSASGPRPEKTDAVARRMIAGALGLKAPKLTEEQKAYQKAIQEKERKRREEEKAAAKRKEEEAAKARAAMWND